MHSSQNGFDLENLDDLFAAAVPSVMEEIRPYLVAVTMYKADPEKAAQKADDIIARLPESDLNVQWAYVLKGYFFSEQKDHVQAEEACRKAIGLNEKNYVAHNNLGNALVHQGRTDEAFAEFRRAIEIEPKDAQARNGLANLLSDQGKIEDASAQYRLGIKHNPRGAMIHNNLGILLYNQGKLDDAAVQFQRAIEINPKISDAHLNLGAIAYWKGKLDEAISHYTDAIAADPKNQTARDYLQLILQERESKSE